MYRSLIVAGVLAMSACSGQGPAPVAAPTPIQLAATAATTAAPTPAAVPAPAATPVRPMVTTFHARSVTSKGVVTDDISGTAEVREKEIRVVLQSGYMELTASSGARPRAVRAVLAYGDTANWNIRTRGSSVAVGSIHSRGDTLTGPVEFTIPVPDHVVLADHWIALLLDANVNVPGRGWVNGGFRPIHSERGIFSGPSRP